MTDEVFAMVPIQAMLATTYIEELRRSAAAERRAHPTDVDVHLHPGRPSGPTEARKVLARVASQVSRAAAATANRLDPSFDHRVVRRPSVVPNC